MSKPEPDFDMGNLEAELRAMLPISGEGMRTAELAAALGVSESKILKLLHKLNAEGRLVVTRATMTALDGDKASVPAYGLKEEQA